MARYLRKFGRNQHGGVTLLVAMAFPALMLMSFAALEYGSVSKRRGALQSAADSGSIAGANQFKLANTDDTSAIQMAISTAKAQAAAQSTEGGSTTQATAEVLGNHSGVHVSVTETVPLTFSKFLGMSEVVLKAESTARLSGSTRLCLLALEPAAKQAFSAEKNARIAAPDCSIYSNSKSPEGISAGDGAVATALAMCSAGGYKGTSLNFVPPPATGCPPLKDPLADRAPPPIDLCISLGSINLNVKDPTKPMKIAKGAMRETG